MAKTKAAKSWAEQLADLEEPAPRELDPEDAGEHGGSGSESNDEDLDEARAHYVDVEKSTLRKRNDLQQDLGAQYAGASISRDGLFSPDEDDDPFGKKKGTQESESESEESDGGKYANPDDDLKGVMENGDEEICSDEAFESGDENKFHGYIFRGSRFSRTGGNGPGEERDESEDEDMDDFDGIEVDSEAEEGEDNSSNAAADDDKASSATSDSDTSMSSSPPKPSTNERATIRKMMAEEKTKLPNYISQDIAKGRAIKNQRTTFDALLSTRIKLQKALVAANSLPATGTTSIVPSSPPQNDEAEAEAPPTIHAAESAALNLWNALTTLRSSLAPTPTPTPTQTTINTLPATPTTPSSTLWSHTQSQETASLPTRRSVLTKWSQRTNPSLGLSRSDKFSQQTQQPLVSVLDAQLTGLNMEKLVAKSQRVQTSGNGHVPSTTTINTNNKNEPESTTYDDSPFYTHLLRELVDQRLLTSSSSFPNNPTTNNPSTLLPPSITKVRKPVDRKASKGRKMRYTVHEKLQNFMAPEDRGGWGERQRGELFGSLLGQKLLIGRGEEGREGEGMEEGEGEGGEEEGSGEGIEMDGMEGVGRVGLRLFG